jgi:hypothetical protein
MHHCKDAEFVTYRGVQHTVWKAMAEPSADLTTHDWSCFWVNSDCFGAPLHLCEEGRAKPRPFQFVVLRRVVELALGQLIERDAHGLDPRPSVTKHVCGRSRR